MLKNITKRPWFWWLVLGCLLRIILMPTTLHSDLWGFVSSGYIFVHEKVINIYDYIVSQPPDSVFIKSIGNIYEYFIYPPLAYFLFGIFYFPVSQFVDPSFIPNLWKDSNSIYSDTSLYLNLFLFKLPYFFLDIGAAYFLSKIFKEERKRRYAFIFWIFNPLTLYATFMVGQYDLIPTLFTILALYFAEKKKFNFSILSLGIGGSFKMYPLLFIFPAAFIFGERFYEKLKYAFLGFLPFFMTIIPFINSAAFRQMVLFSPKNQKMLFMGLHVSGAEVIYPFVVILTLIFIHAFYVKEKYEIEDYFLFILLLFFSVTHYHPQWFLWITPFLIIYLIKTNFRYLVLVALLFTGWFLITLFFEPSLSWGLFNPLNPHLKETLGLSDIVSKYLDIYQIKSLIRSFFAGISIFIFLTLDKKRGLY